MTSSTVFVWHLLLTWLMTGVIWMVQLVHYPLFSYVERERFSAFESQHTARISWIVMPAMLLELASAVWLVWAPVGMLGARLGWLNVSILAGIWLSTFLFSVPQHTRLHRGFSEEAHARLVQTNWFRTCLWSIRAVGLGWVLLASMT